jgi:hypothetical protein
MLTLVLHLWIQYNARLGTSVDSVRARLGTRRWAFLAAAGIAAYIVLMRVARFLVWPDIQLFVKFVEPTNEFGKSNYLT